MSSVVDIASGIIFVALIAVIVRNAASAKILGVLGSTFTNSLKIAEQG